jgi:hypothetical protein
VGFGVPIITCVNSIIAILLARLCLSVSEAILVYEELAIAGLQQTSHSHSFFGSGRTKKHHSEHFERVIRKISANSLFDSDNVDDLDRPFTSNADACKT